MSQLIDRQAAIEAIIAETYMDGAYGYADCKSLVDAVESLPSAEPEPMDFKLERKRGKWILADNQRRKDMDNGNYLYICTNCLNSDLHAKTVTVPYCWYCGAYMRGEEDGKID